MEIHLNRMKANFKTELKHSHCCILYLFIFIWTWYVYLGKV